MLIHILHINWLVPTTSLAMLYTEDNDANTESDNDATKMN